MGADALTIGCDRRGDCTGVRRRGSLGLALDAWRRGGARRRRRVARLLGVGTHDLRFDRRRLGFGHRLDRLGDRLHFHLLLGRRHHFRPLLRRGRRDLLFHHFLLLDRFGRRGIGLIHQLVRRTFQRRRLRRGRDRRQVDHDRRQSGAGVRLQPRPVHADRDQCGMHGEDCSGRDAPAPQYGLVGNVVERERVHGASCVRRGRPARS